MTGRDWSYCLRLTSGFALCPKGFKVIHPDDPDNDQEMFLYPLCWHDQPPVVWCFFFFASKRQKHDTHLMCVCVWPQTLSLTVIVLKCLSYYQWIDRVWVTLALVRVHNCCIFCPLLLNCTLRRGLVLVALSASGAGVHSKPPHQSFDVSLSGWKLIQRGPARCSTLSSHLLICLLFPILRSGTQPRVPFRCVP